MRRIACIAALSLGLFASALGAQQTMPALFEVRDVASDDVLNIRSAPSAESEVLGSFASDATGIEVTAIAENGAWGRVNVAEGTGWVSLAYLQAQPSGGAALAPTFQCFGTEPFWSLDVTQNGVSSLDQVDKEPRTFFTGPVVQSSNTLGTYAMLGFGVSLVMHRQECSDGMSDRAFALSADLLLSGPESVLSGCCSLATD